MEMPFYGQARALGSDTITQIEFMLSSELLPGWSETSNLRVGVEAPRPVGALLLEADEVR